MDEESFGLFAMLLIVTALVLGHPLQKSGYAAPALPSVSWADVISLGCGDNPADGCSLAMSQ
jgi:hypothetical protein